MRSIRVAMIAPPWLSIPPSGYGGVENVLATLVPALMDLGADVTLFTTGDSALQATHNHSLYETGQYKHIHRPLYESLAVPAAHLLFALNAIKEDGAFDIIHSHDYLTPIVATYLATCLPPVLHTIHGPLFHAPERAVLTPPDSIPMWRQFKNAERLWFVAISYSAARSAPRELKSRMLAPVHNAVDVAAFPFVDKKDDYFITLARSHPEKGQAQAIRACQRGGFRLKLAGVVADMTNPKQVMLELANPSSQYRTMTDFRYFSDKIFPHLDDDQIQYVGDLSGQAKMNFISHAKALLFPIQWEEPFGMAPIEALACGTPVVAMARGALPEIIQHGVNGFLARNDREFYRYMQRVGEIDPVACRKSVEQNFFGRIMARRYMARYRSVLKRQDALASRAQS